MNRRRSLRATLVKAGATTMAIEAALALTGVVGIFVGSGHATPATTPASTATTPSTATSTPIKHVVVIDDEGESFDHDFATYPRATNPAGEPAFTAAAGTPAVNGLAPSAANGNTNLLTANPNGALPQRLDPLDVDDVLTCDQNHSYGPDQAAEDGGKMDAFPGNAGTAAGTSPTGQPCEADTDLDYYDGNTVTALWNYAQHFAMSDNSFATTFGSATPGSLNLVSGDTGNVNVSLVVGNGEVGGPNPDIVADGDGGFSDIADTSPYYDDCFDATSAIALSGHNVGDQLNAAGLSWGWFQGGFAPTSRSSVTGSDPGFVSPTVTGGYEAGQTPAVCAATHNVGAAEGGTGSTGTKAFGTMKDYVPRDEPFQFYASTANPHHLAPASLAAVGTDTQSFTATGQPEFNTANHQYDLSIFNDLLTAIDDGQLSPTHLPAVSYLKAPAYQDGHPAYSDPLDEQRFLTTEINAIEHSPDWPSTAIIVAYDDSDGWYDHVYAAGENGGQPQNASQTAQDDLTAAGECGTATPTLDNAAGQPEQGRCGYGPRLPLLVISPYARGNAVDHHLSDQSSIVKFIQQNWGLGSIPGSATTVAGSLNTLFDFTTGQPRPPIFLSPATGEVVRSASTATVSAPPSTYGNAARVTVTVRGGGAMATGAVKLTGAGTAQTRSLSAGRATFTLPRTLSVGIRTLTASYGGSTILLASAHHQSFRVLKRTANKPGLKITAKPSRTEAGGATISVSHAPGLATPTGTVTVTLKLGTTAKRVSATLHSARASVTLPKLPKKGRWSVSASYHGNGTYAARTSSTLKITVT